MAEIVLTTLNAKYIHAAFGLRYLLANMGELRPISQLAEFDINQRPLDIAEVLLALIQRYRRARYGADPGVHPQGACRDVDVLLVRNVHRR